MVILSLFDGMSTTQQALHNLGIKDYVYYASEIDKYAIATTQNRFPKTVQLGDIKNIDTSKLPKIDLIIGGFPCQSHSIAGNRKGLDDPRGQLIYDFWRIIKYIKPKYLIAENVASMGKDMQEYIRQGFEEAMGEPITITMLDAALVSAQRRKRIFFTNLGSIPLPKNEGIILKDVLEDKVDEKYYVKSPLVLKRIEDLIDKRTDHFQLNNTKSKLSIGKKSSTLVSSYGRGVWGGGRQIVNESIFIGGISPKKCINNANEISNNIAQGQRVYSPNAKAITISANAGGLGAKTGLYLVSSTQEHATVNTKKSSPLVASGGMGGGHIPILSAAFRGRHLVNNKRKDVLNAPTEQRLEIGTEKSNCLSTVQKDSMVTDLIRVRKLTPIECCRLQSMPDDYFNGAICNNKSISDSQKYKMLGNGFNCKIIEHILKHII